MLWLVRCLTVKNLKPVQMKLSAELGLHFESLPLLHFGKDCNFFLGFIHPGYRIRLLRKNTKHANDLLHDAQPAVLISKWVQQQFRYPLRSLNNLGSPTLLRQICAIQLQQPMLINWVCWDVCPTRRTVGCLCPRHVPCFEPGIVGELGRILKPNSGGNPAARVGNGAVARFLWTQGSTEVTRCDQRPFLPQLEVWHR